MRSAAPACYVARGTGRRFSTVNGSIDLDLDDAVNPRERLSRGLFLARRFLADRAFLPARRFMPDRAFLPGRRFFLAGRFLLAVTLLLAALPVHVAAQPGSAERSARLTRLFSDMSLETGVRVTTPQLFIEHGSFRGLGPETVRIDYGGEVVPVDLRDIRTVEVGARHPVKGMLWGLGSGLLVGSVSGLLLASFYCDNPDDCHSAERRGALLGGGVLGAGGALAGFVIGRYQVSWRPVFP